MSLLSRLRVIPIPALEDNYMYLIFDNTHKKALAVDPVEPKKLLEKVREEKVDLEASLVTHHHWDHAGGNKELRSLLPNIRIYGGDDRIDEMNTKVSHEEKIDTAGLQIRCLSTPCHTKGHVCYVVSCGDDQVVFTGDTLFIAGCGKFFEGDGEGMHRNLNKILSSLPENTLVFPGHEYTASNLKFAVHAEPSNQTAAAKLEWAQEMGRKKIPTVPSSIGEEKQINPFMRVSQPDIQKFVGAIDPACVMSKLREAKNSFRP